MNKYILLINETIVVDIVECEQIEITYKDERASITFNSTTEGEGRMVGVNADFYILEECPYKIGDIVTEVLNDKKHEFVKEV